MMNTLQAYASGMYGSLDTSFDENKSLYEAKVVGRNSRFPRNGVTVR
jgi:hypothetical protein